MRLQERIDLYAKAFPKFEPLYLTKLSFPFYRKLTDEAALEAAGRGEE
jgi:hypothetical protein